MESIENRNRSDNNRLRAVNKRLRKLKKSDIENNKLAKIEQLLTENCSIKKAGNSKILGKELILNLKKIMKNQQMIAKV